MKGSGASRAASGIQLWKGIDPALDTAPMTRRTKARPPRPPVPTCIVDIASDLFMDQRITMPSIMQRSVTPAITKALTAVFMAPSRPIAMKPKSVSRRLSQKMSMTARLSASTAPLTWASVMRR